MSKTNLMIRTCGPAIAAALAFTSTAACAQEAEPTATTTSTIVEHTTPASPDPSSSEPATVTTTTTTTTEAAPEAAPVASKSAKTTVTKVTRASTDPATTPPVTAKAAAPVAAQAAPASQPPSPIPEAQPAQIAQAADAQKVPTTTTEPVGGDAGEIAFGGALALLVLAAGALGLSRRRKAGNAVGEEIHHRETVMDARVAPLAAPVRREVDLSPPSVVPAVTGRPAFSWGAQSRQTALTPTERAKQGPTPDNPSLSLKKRLKRAAFFERREMDAASGRAPAMSRFAGLPDRVVDAARRSSRSFGGQRTLQPA